MSKRFPTANYKDVIRIAKKLGFYFSSEGPGSHEIWRRNSDNQRITVPNHGKKDIKRKTLKSIITDFGISSEKFIKLRKGK
ncbi:type II toxin-antitoxin system HicA family toxin [Patescibacteria group bacterium]|nr:type II toxin-antitoxin system HicA family toxin [Patescibacteria group bacterium]MBU4512785.1 type II toxin-antitoxin system HicA family toxin [Patescibacteria group bacterium]MCG2692526.1 type II toxin-antitoxin system HicA family toxin [Candidatus Parcubacteria bacterium]